VTPRVRLLALAVQALVMLAWSGVARAQAAPAAPTSITVGDWRLAPVAEVRARGEYRHDVNAQDDGLVVERARLGLDALDGPVEARVVLQDARTVDVGGTTGPVGGPAPSVTTGAYEAWVDAHAGSSGTFVRVGRQPVRWGEGRLLGIDDWTASGRSLDAVRGRLIVGDGAFEVLGSLLSDPTISPLFVYGELLGARAEWAFDPLLAAELYGLARFARGNVVPSPQAPAIFCPRPGPCLLPGEMYTLSLRLHGESSVWLWGAEGALQHMDPSGIAAPSKVAFAGAGHVERVLDRVLLRPALRLGGAYASGDGERGTFDPLLPDVHVWHGAMDLFAWSNEAEVNGRVTVVPWTDGMAAVEYRYARLAQAQGNWTSAYLVDIGSAGNANTSADLGHEVDATLHWSPWAPLDLDGGYSFFVLGSGAKAVLASRPPSGKAASVSQYAYAQVTLRIP
jgi:hypothetical protein